MDYQRVKRWALLAAGAVLLAGCAKAPMGSAPTDAPTLTPAPPTERPASTPTAASTSTPTVEPTATATPDTPSLFELVDTGPIVEHDTLPNHSATLVGPMIRHEGLTYVFYGGFPEHLGIPMHIGYAASGDMQSWQSGEALFASTDFDFGRQTPYASPDSAVIEADGGWTLYLSVWEPRRNGLSAIFRATAPAPVGPWTIDQEPVLLPSAEEGAWDHASVFGPYVIRTEDGYVMYYNARAADDSKDAIGMATSADGIAWEKHPEPILPAGADGAWDAEAAAVPVVQRVGDDWLMLYTSLLPSGERAFGLALSEDGVAWTRHPANPVFTPDDIPRSAFLHSGHFFCDADRCWLVVEILQGNVSDLWLAEQVGDLAP